ncbi:MAG: universal stress protein [Dehalococcoidia bacterium]
MRKILVPLDGSALSEQAIPQAAGLARELEASVHIVTVAPPFDAGPDMAMAGLLAGAVANPYVVTSEAGDERSPLLRSEDYLNNLRMRLESEGVSVSYEVRVGEPVDELLAAADAQDADLIAIASHGRSGFQRAMLGSVADELLRRSGRPVMVIRAAQEEAP